IKIEQQGGNSEIRTVESAGGDTITLMEGLKLSYSLATSVNVPTITSLEFDLIVNSPAVKQPEKYGLVSMHPDHPNYWGTLVTSNLITLEEPSSAPNNPIPEDSRPVAQSYPLGGGQPDNRPAAVALIKANPKTYLDYLCAYDDISLVAIPGITDTAV